MIDLAIKFDLLGFDLTGLDKLVYSGTPLPPVECTSGVCDNGCQNGCSNANPVVNWVESDLITPARSTKIS
jgi:hypothetical protein